MSGSASGTDAAVRPVPSVQARVVEPPVNLPIVAPESELVPPSAAIPTRQTPPPAPSASVAEKPIPISVEEISALMTDVAPAPVVEEDVSAMAVAAVPQTAPPSLSSAVAAGSEDDDDSLELPELSPEATAFFISKRYVDSDTALMRDFHLNQDDISFLQEMDQLVLGGSLPLDGYVTALQGEFPSMTSAQRDQLIARLLADRFVPWGDALKPNAQEVARKNKLSLPATPYYMVYTKPLTYSGAAGEVARSVDLPMGGQIRERLRDLVMSRAKGIRVDAQVEEQMIRPTEFGGMGLEREKARMAILSMSDILSRAQVMTEENYSAWLTEQARRAANPQADASSMPKTKEDEDDQKEIAAISAKMPKPVRDTSSVLALSTATLIGRLSIKPDGEYLVRRLENLVSTRLRDVRSRHDVLQTLSRDIKVGGLGLSRNDAEQVSNEIEDGYNEFRTIIAQEEKDKLDVQAQEQTRKIEERKKREAEEHARWFQEKVKGQQMQTASQQELVQRMRVFTQGLTSPMSAPVAAHPIDVKEKVKEEAELGELVVAPPPAPASTPSKQISPIAAFAPQKTALEQATPTKAVPADRPTARPPEVPVVKVSAVTAKANETSAGAMRPRMDDIRPMTARMSGPLAEIQNLNLASFRRMAKTPSEGAAQIQRKIDLLAQESFERRIEGIQAWQSSPLQQAYLTLVAEAFAKATPVNALATQKRAAGEDGLSPEELAAVVELNGKLHF
jgi:hypothetical protein